VVLLYLHLLGMALFVGGQLVLAFAVVPALRERDREGLIAVARRFGWASVIALGVLIVTGVWMASRDHLWDNSTLHVKMALVALVTVLILWHLRAGTARWLQGAIFVVSLVIVWLGIKL
jgi:uncharacterized membrane protein